MSRRRRCLSLPVFMLMLVCTGRATQAGSAIEPDFLMDSDPKLQIPKPVRTFDPAMKALWLAALDRPEIDMQRMAAETIARARESGMPDLSAAVPRLEEILLAESSHPAARFAAARALISLDSRTSGEKLFRASQAFGSDLRQLVEPALAQWDYGPARTMWNERLAAADPRLRDLVLAMRGLGQVREQAALARLVSIAGDSTRKPDLRLEAAAAAGQIAESGLERDAGRLARKPQTPHLIDPLCAVRFLARHHGDDARRLLIELAGHAHGTVAAAALTRLNEIDSALVAPLAESALKNSDPQVRRQGATAFLKLPTADRIAALGPLLADAHPGVRGNVAESLVRMAENPELSDPIRDAAMLALAGDRWQGQEQSALLLGALEHKPAANRLVELLESPRPQVALAAAWALRKVAVARTIPALIDKARRQTQRRRSETLAGVDDEVARLFEALGVLKAEEAVPLLLEYVPKDPIMGVRSRSAAIWALGRIREGMRDAALEDALSNRIADFPETKPESDLVKQMCAVALVRMGSVDEAPHMRSIAESGQVSLPLNVALRWAVKELTGEEMPPPEPPRLGQSDWFLVPTSSQAP